MSQPADTLTATLLRLVNGYQISQAVHVAAELRLADLIDADPVSVPDISAQVEAHPGSLYRLLRALATVGVFREIEDRRFVASPMSELLRTDHPQSMWGWLMLIGRAAGLEGRCEMVEGSYFDGVPAGGDAYIFKSVLMDHTDETCAAILRRVRTAMDPHGTVLVIEGVISAANENPRSAFSDLMMLVGTGGFALHSITPTTSRFQILEGRSA